MPLIKCKECDQDISDKAIACPNCGSPQSLAPPTATGEPRGEPPKSGKRKTHPVTWAVLAVVVVVVAWSTLRSRQEANLPTLPITVQYRPALLGPGLVLELHNSSAQPLPFVLTLERPATGVTQKRELYAGSNGTVKVGHLEGWIAQTGDHIRLENANYQRWEGQIP